MKYDSKNAIVFWYLSYILRLYNLQCNSNYKCGMIIMIMYENSVRIIRVIWQTVKRYIIIVHYMVHIMFVYEKIYRDIEI